MTPCPGDETLDLLLAGRLPDPGADAVGRHVDACPRCLRQLDQRSDDTELRNWIPEGKKPATPPDGGLQRLVERLRQASFLTPVSDDTQAYAGGGTAAAWAEKLESYRVEAELGRGGMGVVLRAVDEALGRTVALKVLRPDCLDDRAWDRLAREAQAVACVRHDNVVGLHAVHRPADGPPVLVMEYVPGPSLRQAIDQRRGPLPARLAAEVCAQVADGLHAAHLAGLVHRDVKPGNVLLDAHTGRARLTDFGLARAVAADAGLTREGALVGTPAYLSPEQVRTPEAVDARSDVYGLGVTLYEALTGVLPFRASVLPMLLQQVLLDDPPPPARLNDAVPRDLQVVCLKALAKEPHRRYATAAALADDLRRWVRGEPVHARPVGVAERAWRWARRNPRTAGLVAGIVVAVAAGVAGVSWQWRRAERHLEESVQAKALAEENFREARDAVDRYFVTVSDSKLLAAPGLQPLRRQLLEDAARYYAGFLSKRGDDAEVTFDLAETSFKLARIRRALGDRAAGLAADRDAARYYERLVELHPDRPEYRSSQAISLAYLAGYAREDGKADEAIDLLERARRIWERLGDEDPENVQYQGNLANCLNQLGGSREAARPGDGEPLLREAAEVWERLAAAHPDVFEYRDNLARLNVNRAALLRGRPPAEALGLLEQATALWERRLADHPATWQTQIASNLGLAYGKVGEVHQAAGDWPRALAAFEKERAVFDRLVTANPAVPGHKRSLAATWNVIGVVQLEQRRFTEALASLDEARRLQEQVLAAKQHTPDQFDLLARVQANRGLALLELRRPKEARESFAQAVEQGKQAVSRGPGVATFRRTLGVAWFDLGRTERMLGRSAAAFAAVSESRPLLAMAPRWLADVGREMARCAGLAEGDERERYAKAAVATLLEAVRVGWRDGATLGKDPAFAALRGRKDFELLVKEQAAPLSR